MKETDSEPVLARRALSSKQQVQMVTVVIIGIAGVIALGWVGSKLFAKQGFVDMAPALPPSTFRASDAQLASLKVQRVAESQFRTEESTDGKIALNADAMTSVYSPYSGRVIKVLAGIGEYVKQGAPLLEIDATEYSQAQSDLRNAQAQLKLAQINEERKHAAYDAKGGSLQDWQQSQVDLTNAENTLSAARNRLHVFGKSNAEIDALVNVKTNDAVTYVVAPISGVVTDRQVGPGQYVQAAASTPVYTIGDLKTVWLVANVREVDAPRIQRGQTIAIHVLALPDKTFTSKLSSIGASIDPVSRRIPVRAVLDNSDGLLKPEMFASVTIASSATVSAPAVPSEAIIYEGDRARVWVLQNKNDIGLREIRIGRTSNGLVEVVEGLKAGERVVTSGSLFIDRAARPD